VRSNTIENIQLNNEDINRSKKLYIYKKDENYMSYCKICKKKYKDPNYATSQRHLSSKFHQEKLKKIKKTTRVTDLGKVSELDVVSELTQLKDLVLNMENRISNIEKFLNLDRMKIVSKKNEITSKESQIRNLEEEIINSINQQSHIQHIKGNFPIKNVRKIVMKKFNISEKDFEDIILRLYRKQIIDLQTGGDPNDYHLLSPTGKKFYYLITKT